MLRLSACFLLLPSAVAWSQENMNGTVGSYTRPNVPKVYAPTRPRTVPARSTSSKKNHPWKRKITTTVFWIGEAASANNPTPNHASAWDRNWERNFGGYDTPDRKKRYGYRPRAFYPRTTPFYVALPYNDVMAGAKTRPEAARVIPWFKKRFKRPGRTVLKGQWIAIRHGNRICYAQWEDVGPFVTDDWMYVFGNSRPKNRHNRSAGLDVSPAVRDHLRMKSGAKCDWKFVNASDVPMGPWKTWSKWSGGSGGTLEEKRARLKRLREERDRWFERQGRR